MQALKIAVIGGGSSYTPELIEGIIVRYEQLPVTELALVDVESGREKVEIIAALTRRMLKRKGLEQVAVSVALYACDEAIRGASFVLTQLRVGQLAARAADERLGLKYHLLGQETTGVGGFAKALRTIPVILEVARKVEAAGAGSVHPQLYQPGGDRHRGGQPLQHGEDHRPVQRADQHAAHDRRDAGRAGVRSETALCRAQPYGLGA